MLDRVLAPLNNRAKAHLILDSTSLTLYEQIMLHAFFKELLENRATVL